MDMSNMSQKLQVRANLFKKHPLFSEVTDGRGVAYERIGDWENAEKDLITSLEVLGYLYIGTEVGDKKKIPNLDIDDFVSYL